MLLKASRSHLELISIVIIKDVPNYHKLWPYRIKQNSNKLHSFEISRSNRYFLTPTHEIIQ